MTKLEEEISKISEQLAVALKRQLELSEVDEHQFDDKECTAKEGFLKFHSKEILKMPEKFRKIFRAEGCTVHFRKRVRGKISCSYEARYRRHGYNISVSASTIDKLKARFIVAIKNADSMSNLSNVPTTFDEFATYYFTMFRQRKVSAQTYKNDLDRYKRHIQPYFGSTPLKKITPTDCQRVIDKIISAGLGRTMEEVYSLLNCIFKNAQAHYIIERNPLSIVVKPFHERKHGKALTKDEEKKLLAESAGTPYQIMFAVALYTGLRPNEYSTAKIDGDFIVAVNSKRKNHKVEFKKIPISCNLKPFLQGISVLKFYGVNRIREKFHSIFPEKRLYDLRTTFYTRCCECGVAEAALMEFVGHSRGKLADTYTDLSDEFLLKEGEKLNY